MRTLIVAPLVAASALAGSTAVAAPSPSETVRGKGGNFGLGLTLGDPMGASLKYFAHPNHAIQADIGWLPLHHGSGGLSIDYLWHPAALAKNRVVDFVIYLGFGIGVGVWGDGPGHGGDHFGRGDRDGAQAGLMLRVPIVGFALHWKNAPFDTVLEGGWSPFVVEGPDPRFGPAHGSVALKARYYF